MKKIKATDRTDFFKNYQNKWVALTEDDKVISADPRLDKALSKARDKGVKDPIITKVPDLRYEYLL